MVDDSQEWNFLIFPLFDLSTLFYCHISTINLNASLSSYEAKTWETH